jgi:hypothetical protein
MPAIFISYRRGDAEGEAGRLFALKAAVVNVMVKRRDIDHVMCG